MTPATPTWTFLDYVEGRRHDGFAGGMLGETRIHCPIRIKKMEQYVGAKVIERKPMEEGPFLDMLTELALIPEMNDPTTSVEVEASITITFFRERGARIGTVLASGEIAWEP